MFDRHWCFMFSVSSAPFRVTPGSVFLSAGSAPFRVRPASLGTHRVYSSCSLLGSVTKNLTLKLKLCGDPPAGTRQTSAEEQTPPSPRNQTSAARFRTLTSQGHQILKNSFRKDFLDVSQTLRMITIQRCRIRFTTAEGQEVHEKPVK